MSRTFRWLASRLSNCTAYSFELVAAGVSGDLAYTVGYEHTAVSMDGVPAEPYTLRVTHVYRHENGEWKIVYRHGTVPDRSEPSRGGVDGVGDHLHANSTPKTVKQGGIARRTNRT